MWCGGRGYGYCILCVRSGGPSTWRWFWGVYIYCVCVCVLVWMSLFVWCVIIYVRNQSVLFVLFKNCEAFTKVDSSHIHNVTAQIPRDDGHTCNTLPSVLGSRDDTAAPGGPGFERRQPGLHPLQGGEDWLGRCPDLGGRGHLRLNAGDARGRRGDALLRFGRVHRPENAIRHAIQLGVDQTTRHCMVRYFVRVWVTVLISQQEAFLQLIPFPFVIGLRDGIRILGLVHDVGHRKRRARRLTLASTLPSPRPRHSLSYFGKSSAATQHCLH